MNQFEARLLAEGVRAVEGESPIRSTYSAKGNSLSFEQLLLQRASQHSEYENIKSLYLHFDKITKTFYHLFALMLFVLGGLAVNNMLFSEQLSSVNFFWAFALFFIPNIFMLLIWLVVFLRPSMLANASLFRFSLWVIKAFENRFNKASLAQKNYIPLFNCYFNTYFGKQLGRYQLSTLTHRLWLSYFTGATLMSLIMLATHQVDFVWQTSILSSDTFTTLTQLLAYLPEQLGFPVPSIEQIQQSYLDASDLLGAENRRLAWSSLLISSLLLYGVLPRLFLLLLMSYRLQQKKNLFQLDLSAPYYVQLRQCLKPNKSHIGVTDADSEELGMVDREAAITNQPQQSVLPRHYYPTAIELSDRQFGLAKSHLEQNGGLSDNKLVNICDHLTQQHLLAQLTHCEEDKVVIYVALKRLPDRGLKRFIAQLSALPDKSFYIAIIVEGEHNKQRDNDWYQLANQVGIKLDNIVHIEAKGASDE